MRATTERVRFSIGFKLVTIITILVLVSLGANTLLVSYTKMFRPIAFYSKV